MQPAKITLFLVKGSPTGLRTAEISNWTGKSIAGPRSDLNDLLARKELQSPGVYFLTGIDPDSGEPAIYIGESENVAKRLKRHVVEDQKDYWVHTSAFVSKDDNLTKAHIRYLEGKLIKAAHDSKRAVIMNSTSSGSPLPEADRAEMDVFFYRVLQLLPVLGIHHLSAPVLTQSPPVSQGKTKTNDTTDQIFFCKGKGLIAKGKRSEDGFTVFSGSQAVKVPNKACATGVLKHRDRLIEKAIIKLDGDYYVFTEDYEFSSPSTAASLVKGGSVNGLTAWTTEDNRSLKALES